MRRRRENESASRGIIDCGKCCQAAGRRREEKEDVRRCASGMDATGACVGVMLGPLRPHVLSGFGTKYRN